MKIKLNESLTLLIADNSAYVKRSLAFRISLQHMARLAWAPDMNVGTGSGNGPLFAEAWHAADDYLRSMGLRPEWDGIAG